MLHGVPMWTLFSPEWYLERAKGETNSRRWDVKKKRKIKCHELYSSMFNSHPPGRSERGLLIGSPETEYIRCKGTQSPGCGRERASTPQMNTFPLLLICLLFRWIEPKHTKSLCSFCLDKLRRPWAAWSECKTLEKKWRKLPHTPRWYRPRRSGFNQRDTTAGERWL